MEKAENIKYKFCSRCKETKPTNEFHKDKSRKDGLFSYCKSCAKENSRKWKEANKEKEKENVRRWRETNPEKVKENRRKWRKENPKKTKESGRKWYKANIEKAKEDSRKRYEANFKKVKENQRKWKKENRKYYNQYYKNKRVTNPLYKLRCNISDLIRTSLRNQRYTKRSQTFDILGIDFNGFHEWLNGKASNNLNYGDDIQLDHVIPVSLAKTEDEILLLNHYSNFQLLSQEENLSKKNFYVYRKNLDRVLFYHPNFEMLKKIVDRSKIEIKENE